MNCPTLIDLINKGIYHWIDGQIYIGKQGDLDNIDEGRRKQFKVFLNYRSNNPPLADRRQMQAKRILHLYNQKGVGNPLGPKDPLVTSLNIIIGTNGFNTDRDSGIDLSLYTQHTLFYPKLIYNPGTYTTTIQAATVPPAKDKEKTILKKPTGDLKVMKPQRTTRRTRDLAKKLQFAQPKDRVKELPDDISKNSNNDLIIRDLDSQPQLPAPRAKQPTT